MTTKFPLGLYVGNPNGSDPASEAWFETQFKSFVSIMDGATPTTMNAFVDFTQGPSTWASSTSWTAWSWSQSPVVTTKMIPIIGIPMSDNQHWAGNAAGMTNDDFFKSIINGSYDYAYKGIVDSWSGAGFKTMEFRLGWEMNGDFMPWFMGKDAATQSDWVKAFQHISTLMRSEAAADGVSAKIVWNPGSMGWTTLPTENAYPGDAYVDVVSLDSYSPLYPAGYYDWAKNDGTNDATIQQWWANPANKAHFWSNPDANQWNPNGTGVGFGMDDAIAFAKAHGKALALSETGAGGNGTTLGPVDEPDFPAWLAGALSKAQAQGVTIDHVNIWDSAMSDGNWSFQPGAGKPLEAAAWAKYFGANSGTVAAAPPVAPPVAPLPSKLILTMSEDAYLGNAQFIVSVDGIQQGGVQTVTASHGAGATQDFAFNGDWTGPHSVSVNFLNDAWGGSAATDRNLYIDNATFNAVSIKGATSLMSNGAVSFGVTGNAAAVPAVGVDTLRLSLSEDAWQGDAQAVVTVDGKVVGSTVSVTASHALGKTQAVSLTGQWGPGAHDVGVQFINDAYGGTAATDRNLYVTGVSLDGQASASAAVGLFSNGTAHFATAASPLVLQLSEDAYQGDAQFTVAVDGKVLGAAQSVSTLHASGTVQNFSFGQAMATGTHDIAVSFLNDAWGGTAATDRNLYVNAIDVNGTAMAGTAANLQTTSTQHFSVIVAAPV